MNTHTSLRDYNRRFSVVGLALVTLIAARLLAQIVLELAIYLSVPAIAEQWWYSWLLSFVPLYGVALPLTLVVLRTIPATPCSTCYVGYLPDRQRAILPKPAFSAIWMLPIIVMAMGYMYIGNYMGQTVMAWLTDWMGYDYGNSLITMVDESPLWMTLVGSVILGPLGEELIFRKLLMDRARFAGDTPAILVSAFFFALFHGNLYQFFYAFLLGLLLGYLYAYTGQLRWPAILHMTANFIGSIVPTLLRSLVDIDALSSADPAVVEQAIAAQPLGYLAVLGFTILTYGLMIAAVVLTVVFILNRRICLGRGEVTLRPGERLGVVLGNPGMLLAFVAGMLMLLSALLSHK